MRAIRPDDAAVTGRGLVTAFGFGLDATFDALRETRSAVAAIGDADAHRVRAHAAVIPEPHLRTEVPRELEPQIKFLNGAGELAVEAVAEAAREAQLAQSGIDAWMRGLYLAQMDSRDWSCPEFRPAVTAATEDFERPLEAERLNRAAARRVKPFFMLESLKNNAFSFLATMFELRGANTSVAGFAGPTHELIGMAARSLARRTLDLAVVAGAARPASATARVEMELQAFTCREPDGASSVRNAPGDGAAAIVFERVADARARGGSPSAVLLGHTTTTARPAARSWAPRAETLRDAAVRALDEAGIEPGDLLGVVAPGVGERGLEEALGGVAAAAGAPHVSWKAATGHMALASDAADVVLVSRALEQEELPGAAPVGRGSGVLVLTAGFLGQAGALVLTALPGSTGDSA